MTDRTPEERELEEAAFELCDFWKQCPGTLDHPFTRFCTAVDALRASRQPKPRWTCKDAYVLDQEIREVFAEARGDSERARNNRASFIAAALNRAEGEL